MALLQFKRSPRLYWTAVASVVGAHLILCHPAATCRGYPPLREHELLLMFVAPFLMGVPALFDDRRSTRWQGVLIGSAGMALIYGTVLANFQSARPHIGHLAGITGIVQTSWLLIPFLAFVPFCALVLTLSYYESVAGDFWPLIRRLSDCSNDESTNDRDAEHRG